MADALSITVKARDAARNKGTGSKFSRKLRATGQIPAVIYGHKQAVVPISIAKDDVLLMLKKQAHLAQLKIDGGAGELAVVRAVQWDHLGKEIIHLDFVRVDADEAVVSDVPLEFAGEAPAVANGGMVEPVLRHLKIRAKPTAIPRALKVDISALDIGQSIYVRDLKLPEGVAALDSELEQLVVHAIDRKAAAEPEAEAKPEAEKK
jgi:large subunit ribosomal protein L25